MISLIAQPRITDYLRSLQLQRGGSWILKSADDIVSQSQLSFHRLTDEELMSTTILAESDVAALSYHLLLAPMLSIVQDKFPDLRFHLKSEEIINRDGCITSQKKER
jgi:hypothetical protein